MSLSFKPNNSDAGNSKEKECVELYATPGNARNVCFVQADGRSIFLNYAYLVSGSFFPNEEKIQLVFTSNTVEIRGKNLEPLFNKLSNQEIKRLLTVEERYVSLKETNSICVTKLNIL